MSKQNSNMLSVNSLVVRHGLLEAVRSISFDVREGEVLAIVGANGAGKTTLLRCLAGSHKPSSGTVQLNGQDVTNIPDYERVKLGIALVPEGRHLFSQLTVEENLLLAKGSKRSGNWSIDKVMESFPNLKPLLKRKAGDLSGGQQQATAIGRALMTNPDLLILDEVSLGLSPLIVGQVYEQLTELIAAGTTIILVEQDLNRVMQVSDRIICMLEGEIVASGNTSEMTRETITDAYFGLNRVSKNKSSEDETV